MLLFQGLREYARSSAWPEQSDIAINLKRDLRVVLNIPNFGVAANNDDGVSERSLLTRVVLAHGSFKVALQPDLAQDVVFYKRCVAEVNAISLFFPDIKTETVRIAFAAWLAFACAMDDILETLDESDTGLALSESIQVLQFAPANPPQTAGPPAHDKRIQALSRVLFDHCARYLSQASAQAFFKAVCGVLQAHLEEFHFLHGHHRTSFPVYMAIRSRTIALNPFFEVIKTEYLEPADWEFNATWEQLQNEVGRVAGLQNDLVGLVRDIQDGEQMNGAMVLMQGLNLRLDNKNQLNHNALVRCVSLVNAEHNESASRCLKYAAHLHRAAESSGRSDTARIETVARVEAVTRHILMMCETHLRWCSSAKRYRLEIDRLEIDVNNNGGVPGQIQPDPSSQPQPAQIQGIETQPTQGQPTASQQLVQSDGIFHGLPAFPDTPDCRDLTALVTGATGLSGYHMVKVLAASPQRWKKIYCVSSRPPPANFFADLGDGASRVEHIAVDLTGDASTIAQRLREKVRHVDHIFYFAYCQPAPEGDVLDLWANAEQLATINVTMFNMFIEALRQMAVRPRRFMLQTGSKQYGFYLGPAAIPAFESDPRVQIDRNFYYEQEDVLSNYCQSVGAAWNVARPSYIVGAVRDGTLNHLIGFGIYAAVQAHLGQSIAFPGDYRAWDREQVQSTGLLNAYFEEWLVLTGKTANEAFNIHDGLSFTWGRLWPYLAQWYNAEWSAPAEDESKYRVMQLPSPQTPRGYGPQATLRSTFSLLEWSLQPQVEEAWKQLAQQYDLVLDPFDDRYRARIFSFSDSAVIGDAPMTTSVRKAREFGFFGTVDSYRSIFRTFHDLAKLKLIPAPVVGEFEG